MRILSVITLFLLLLNSSFAEDIEITLTEMDGPIRCSEESSIDGFFCLNGDDYLIVRSFGDSYLAYGSFNNGPLDHFTIHQIRGANDQLLYHNQRSPDETWFVSDPSN